MVEIVAFDPAQHRPAWDEFITSCYNNPDYVLLSPRFLRWQFLDNPANGTGAYTIWLVLHGDRIVAQLGVVPFGGVAPDGTRFDGAHPINLMVRPDYRAFGLGVVLIRKLLAEKPGVLNPGSNEPGAVLGVGLGMHDLGQLRRYIAVVNAASAMRLAEGGRLPAGMSEAPVGRDAAAIQPVRRLPDDAPARFSFPVPVFGAERSRDFFRWRYENHPAFSYEFLLTPDRRSVLVFHEERERGSGLLVLRLVDFLATEGDRTLLLAAFLATARARGAALVDFFCSLDVYDDALRRAGFFHEADHPDGRIAALFQPLDFRKTGIRVIASAPDGRATTMRDWYVTKADSDQDRPNDRRDIDV